jgi:probable HAF family extracellular repeat protein
MVDLGTLGGSPSNATSQGNAVNDNGQVVGTSSTKSGPSHAFSWTQAGGMVDLGTLGGSPSNGVSESYAVNQSGQVVGISSTADSSLHATLWQPRDTTPPTVTVPAGLAADATSPNGAIVGFSVSAVDQLGGALPVTCVPAAGALFGIGDTTVTCTATDASGNTATASFVVHVRGAAEQLANLAAAVKGVGPGTSLAVKVGQAQAALGVNDPAAASSALKAFANEVAAQQGRKIPAATAAVLLQAAARVGALLG